MASNVETDQFTGSSGSHASTGLGSLLFQMPSHATCKTGGYDCRFVDTPPDNLVCQICLLVAGNAHKVTCCGKVYCKACLDEHNKHFRKCPNCKERGQDFPDIRREQEIQALRVKCGNCENGCGWVGELRSLDDHLTTCGYALLRCPNECIKNNEEVRMLRRDLDHHLENECTNRQYECLHCKDTGRYCDITTNHLDTCPKLEVPCPNSECKVILARCDISVHRSTCEFEKVPCKYAGIGCKEVLTHTDLEQHENDVILHFHLAIETINEQQKKINRQQEEISEQREEMKTVKEEQRMMADNITACQSGLCVFKMPEYHQHKSSKRQWYSPPFYTHTGGYKMCIRVDANGHDCGEDTHVSVFFYLMKGKDDDNLPWPFTGDVTTTLLNQLTDKNHYTRTFPFPQDTKANKRVVDGEKASAGYGLCRFISHHQLDATLNCQYLKDGFLYFRIKVQTAKPMKPWLTCTA